jgi:peptide chain release factor 1
LVPQAEDAEEREFYAAEARDGGGAHRGALEQIRTELIDRDPNDDKDVIIEIRAGAGGDEAACSPGELMEMYSRYADRLGFKHRTLSSSPAEVGGYKDVALEISGDRAFSIFKHEGGTHRVQRVPKTESQGRIHTSTATVAVLPEAEDVEIEIARETWRSTFTAPAARRPEREHHDSAGAHHPQAHGPRRDLPEREEPAPEQGAGHEDLEVRLLEREMQERAEQEGALRQAQVGTGDRSAKVRTYNFPQGRITDHRVGVTSHNLEATLGGDLEEFTQALAAKERPTSSPLRPPEPPVSRRCEPARSVPDKHRASAARLGAAGVPKPPRRPRSFSLS